MPNIQLKGKNYFKINESVSTGYYELDPFDLYGNIIPQITIDCDSTLGDMFIILPEILLFQRLYQNFQLIINDVNNNASIYAIAIGSHYTDSINIGGQSSVSVNVNGAGMVFSVLTDNSWLCVESENIGSQLLVEQTNIYYVDPLRTQNYNPTGSELYPYWTIMDAYQQIVDSGISNPKNPAFICLNNSIEEDVIFREGNIFLTSTFGLGTDGAPIITGSIVLIGSRPNIEENHFSISNLKINCITNDTAIIVGGTDPTQVFLNNLSVQSVGFCIDIKNVNANSTYNLTTANLRTDLAQHCIITEAGTFTIDNIETSGESAVCFVNDNVNCQINNSKLNANSLTCIDNRGTLSVTNSVIKNIRPDGHGIALLTPNAIAIVEQCSFSIPVSASGKCVYGEDVNTPLYLAYQYVYFVNPTNPLLPANVSISLAITSVQFPTAFI